MAANTIIIIWIAHAVAFFTHEYTHSLMAWILGWKQSPFDFYFPKSSAAVFLIQLGINQNVDNAPIFAAGRGLEAAVIAGAGAIIGNGFITYPLGSLVLRQSLRQGATLWSLLGLWLVTASVGNH